MEKIPKAITSSLDKIENRIKIDSFENGVLLLP